MNYPFEELLARLDAPQLQNLMPPGAAKLLAAIDESLVYPKKLANVLVALTPPGALLTNARSRQTLLESLPPKAAHDLVLAITGARAPDPYRVLQNDPFSKRANLQILLGFLGVGMPVVDVRAVGPSETELAPAYPLFPHQIKALHQVHALLEQEPHRVLLHMPTGAGKTRTAMNLIADHLRAHPNAVVVWLAHSEELCEQAASEFEKAWQVLGNRPLKLCRFWGPHEADLNGLRDGLAVAGLAKTYARLRSGGREILALGGRAPFVVIDEAHQAIAPTYRQVLDLFVRPTTEARLLGLSATPGRSWNDPESDAALSDFFARRKVTLHVDGYSNPVAYLIDSGYLARPKFQRISCHTGVSLTAAETRELQESFDIPLSVLTRLGQHHGRNLQIIHEIEKLLRSHTRMIVFAASVDQSDLLAAVLSARGHLAASLSSRTLPADRSRILEQYQAPGDDPQVLCNFGVLTTGFDAPRTSAALIARPTLSLVLYSQMIGRALRGPRAGGNATAEIVTVVDPSLPGFDSVESAFANWEDVWQQEEQE